MAEHVAKAKAELTQLQTQLPQRSDLPVLRLPRLKMTPVENQFSLADITDIGAAGALGLSMLAMGGGLVIADRRRRTPGTSDPGHGATPHGEAAGDLSRGPDLKLVLNQQEVVT